MTDAASEVGAIFSARFRIRKQKESDAANFLIGMSIAYMGLGTLFELRLKFRGLEVSDSHVTLQGTNISPKEWDFEDDFPFPKVGYVSFVEGMSCDVFILAAFALKISPFQKIRPH